MAVVASVVELEAPMRFSFKILRTVELSCNESPEQKQGKDTSALSKK